MTKADILYNAFFDKTDDWSKLDYRKLCDEYHKAMEEMEAKATEEIDNYKTENRRLKEENDQLKMKFHAACVAADFSKAKIQELQDLMKETRRSLNTVIPETQIRESDTDLANIANETNITN